MGFPYIAMPLRKRRGIRNSGRDTDDGKMWVRGPERTKDQAVVV